jgi:large subunit ribosomal protein L9
MKVVITKDHENLGEVDSIVNVADGYARNYLLPRKMAIKATSSAVGAAEKRIAQRETELEAKRHEFEALAAKLNAAEIIIEKDAGEEGKLFGSVTVLEIVQAVKESLDLSLDKRKVQLLAPAKKLGDYQAKVKIFKEISANLKFKVVAKKPEN